MAEQRFQLRGPLTAATIRATRDALAPALAHARTAGPAVVDLAQVAAVDDIGLAQIMAALLDARAEGKTLRVENVPQDVLRRLSLLDPKDVMAAPQAGPRAGALESLGDGFFARTRDGAEFLGIVVELVIRLVMRPKGLRLKAIVEQVMIIGVGAIPILSLIGFLIGVIIAFQAAYQLRDLGANLYVANMVGLSMARELSPFVTGILVAGRSGSAIAAEIATMKINLELDALRTMAIDPTSSVLLPRVIATIIAVPILVALANVLGILGGLVIAVGPLSLSAGSYWDQILIAMRPNDILIGMLKAVTFGIVIATIACHKGSQVSGGSREVAAATTAAVVSSIFWMIVCDAIVTMVFFFVG
ncbi:MAG: MlaE family lipid ABC transporter permease subunit [Planctomycetota bacterium]|nr:MlaE family lipid ABC transporter permease subunit [Planctomycetota bacterium]